MASGLPAVVFVNWRPGKPLFVTKPPSAVATKNKFERPAIAIFVEIKFWLGAPTKFFSSVHACVAPSCCLLHSLYFHPGTVLCSVTKTFLGLFVPRPISNHNLQS